MAATHASFIDLTDPSFSVPTAEGSSRIADPANRTHLSFLRLGPFARSDRTRRQHTPLDEADIQPTRGGLGDQAEEPIIVSSSDEEEDAIAAGPSRSNTGGLILPAQRTEHQRQVERLRRENRRRALSLERQREARRNGARNGGHYVGSSSPEPAHPSNIQIVDPAPPARAPHLGLGGALYAFRRDPAAPQDQGARRPPRIVRVTAEHLHDRPSLRGVLLDRLAHLFQMDVANEYAGVPLPYLAFHGPQEKPIVYSPTLTHPNYPNSRPGFSYDFSAPPIEIDAGTEVVEPDPLTFVCAKCADPLYLGQSGKQKIWALRCGHVFCGKCLATMAKPSAEEDTPFAPPKARLVSKPVPSRREGLRSQGTVREPPPQLETRKTRTGKGRAKLRTKDFLYICPVPNCYKEHWSMKEEGADETDDDGLEGWKPRENDGAVEMFA